jgi:NAD(P)-dependent dehydrogenase (short-subunit alcohol dehydrogenase family)
MERYRPEVLGSRGGGHRARLLIEACRATAVACHVGRWADCYRLIEETRRRCGRLDVLVSNAGMSPLYESLDTVTEELYDKTHAVNLRGPFRLGVLAATHMAEGDGGAIVNIGTAGSLMASVNELPYACAKAGLKPDFDTRIHNTSSR